MKFSWSCWLSASTTVVVVLVCVSTFFSTGALAIKEKGHKVHKHLTHSLSTACNGQKCNDKRKSSKRKLFSDNFVTPQKKSNKVENGTMSYPGDMDSMSKTIRKLRKECKLSKYNGFTCRKLKFYLWLIKGVDNSVANLSPWIELVPNPELVSSDNVTTLSGRELMPENWPEKVVFNALQKWGDEIEFYLFQKYKEFVKTRELKVTLYKDVEVRVAPRTRSLAARSSSSSPRFFWDPGFNLKLKLPFFKDELKVAISTGPSFLAGIGAGIVIIIIKSMFAPFLIGMKWMMYNMFWKDGSPWDMMKMVWGGYGGPEPWESNLPPPAIENYEPPNVHHPHFDNHRAPSHHGGPPPPPWHQHHPDQNLQFSQVNPILQGLASSEGRRQANFKSIMEGGIGDNYGGDNYIPSSALQVEVENYDPFYSPLLSRIDSIFTHLGYHDEGCRERAVCSIYKFPVKYAPYSNLLSNFISKHQSELKRPVTKSGKILRYFKYMKAAKDGQSQGSCIDIYPNCDHDTDSVTNLPMITTFNQLSELMGAEASAPSGL